MEIALTHQRCRIAVFEDSFETAREDPQQFTADRSGNVTGTLTLGVPEASTVLDCPGGQTARLATFSYSNVRVTDSTSGATLAIPGTFSGGCSLVNSSSHSSRWQAFGGGAGTDQAT